MIELITLLLPINLGKHFITVDAYVRARLIDYLVPTIWLQDLVIFFALLIGFATRKVSFSRRYLRPVLIFLAALLPSVFVAENLGAAMFFYVRVVLYALFALYVAETFKRKWDFSRILKPLSLVVLLLGVLAISQWINQGAVFNNYLVFGEQPYDISTFNVARTNIFGLLKIPAYGTFRHPNTLAGFLAVSLFWMYSEMRLGKRNKLMGLAFIAGLVGIVLTFSQVAMAALFLSMVFFLAIKRLGKAGVLLSLFGTLAISLTALFLPTITLNQNLEGDPSFYRRSNLLKSAYQMAADNTPFGVGANNYTIALQDYLPLTQVLVFNQPVHNVFALILAESGIFALLAFLALLIFVGARLLGDSFGYSAVFFITLLQFFILGSFDHYLYTAHQTQILFWLTLGLALSYTDDDAQIQT